MLISSIKVDILMATYNGEKYIKEQIESILNQTHKNLHLIIYDDCSSDTTRKILSEYAKKDERIEIILGEKNVGSTKAFEKLYKISNAEYFLFCDQDDIWVNEKVEKLLEYIVSHNKMVVFSDLRVITENKEIINNSFFDQVGVEGENALYWKKIIMNNVAPGCSMIVKNEIKKYVKYFTSDSILHDWMIIIIASLLNSVGIIGEPLVLYRQHSNNQVGVKSHKDNKNNKYEKFLYYRTLRKKMLIEIIEFLEINNLDKEFCTEIEYMKEYICIVSDLELCKGNKKQLLKKYNYVVSNIYNIEYFTKEKQGIKVIYNTIKILIYITFPNVLRNLAKSNEMNIN
ncbi:MAG: glycosyltransferase family 2 protein [Romboutsia sp.]|uniref:glycosyltransferase family 2 protein n=1 Tax=Romboutsia sp. TaxID=1965302 RepID=UPI003F2A4932